MPYRRFDEETLKLIECVTSSELRNYIAWDPVHPINLKLNNYFEWNILDYAREHSAYKLRKIYAIQIICGEILRGHKESLRLLYKFYEKI